MKASLGFDRELPWWGLVFTVEDQYLNTINGIRYENLNYGRADRRIAGRSV